MNTYIHERPDWPNFRWDWGTVADPLAGLRHRQGLFLGRMRSLGFQLQDEAKLETLTDEVQKSSEIEGENLDRAQVRSSIARRLGMDAGALIPADRHIEGVVEMILDATQQYDAQLTAERLFGWHAALFPTGFSGMRRIQAGVWRDDSLGPMRVVSGPIGKERVHYEAPAASRLPEETAAFLAWFAGDEPLDPVLRAAVAHLWFVTLHPFDDGNGRIARAIADMGLTRSDGSPRRFYSMSAQIRNERKAYYDILERTQQGDLDITPWTMWFIGCLDRAISDAERVLDAVFLKGRFWQKFVDTSINERQRLLLNMLLDGFEGKLTTVKWAKIAKASHDTALRDIQDLIRKDVLVADESGGRSTSYSLRAEEQADGILLRPAVATPLETYSDERTAEFLLSDATDSSDYEAARLEVSAMGLDPDSIHHRKPAE